MIEFQSAHPVRGATAASSTGCRIPSHFNPRAPCGVRRRSHGSRPGRRCFNPRTPCGARRLFRLAREISARISIHAPRVGRDNRLAMANLSAQIFQSTRPVWGATPPSDPAPCGSPHFNPRAPCGARRNPSQIINQISDFNPRTPCGVRHSGVQAKAETYEFQSTHPVRGAT